MKRAARGIWLTGATLLAVYPLGWLALWVAIPSSMCGTAGFHWIWDSVSFADGIAAFIPGRGEKERNWKSHGAATKRLSSAAMRISWMKFRPFSTA